MNVKPLFIFAAFVFFLLSTGQALFSLQTDFYGTWTAKIEEDEDFMTVTLVISESSMIFKAKFYSDNILNENIEEKMMILSWTETFNTDNDTNDIYPDGFLTEISYYGFTETIKIFISMDKMSLIIPEMTDYEGPVNVFFKQKNS